jgi:tetratricopeptide (TPR) repeat protein
MANCILQKGHFYFWKGEPHKGSPLLEEALLLFRELDDRPWTATALHLLGFNELNIPYMQESLSIYRELGYVSGMIEVLKQLGAVELRLGHFDAAHTWLDEALSLMQQHAATVGNSKTVSYDVGDLAFFEGNYELARQYYEDCLAWAERVVSSVSIGFARVRLGSLYLQCGDLQKAALFFRDSLDLFMKSKNLYGINFTLGWFVSLAVVEQRWEKAGILISYVEGHFERPRPPVEQILVDRDLAVIRANLSDDDFARFSAEGSKMTMAEAISLALEE